MSRRSWSIWLPLRPGKSVLARTFAILRIVERWEKESYCITAQASHVSGWLEYFSKTRVSGFLHAQGRMRESPKRPHPWLAGIHVNPGS